MVSKAPTRINHALLNESREYAKKILEGLNASPSHFHAVNYCKSQLADAGFIELKETEKWSLKGGEGYYFTRNGSTICAFLTGSKVGPEAPISSFKIVGCHTDSPCLKVAPNSKISALGYNQLNIMTYGGGLWRTWFDRDLTLAGKVIIKTPGDKLESRYWNAVRPLMKVPSLAIHLDREETFKPNKETHLKPVFSMAVADQLFGEAVEPIEDDKFRIENKHFATLTDLMAKDLSVAREDIVDFELNICDAQPSQLVGLHEEFVSSPRLDNLASSFASLDALIQHSKADKKTREHAEVDMIMLFDHEEIGSTSAQGADSNMAVEVTQRIFNNLGTHTQEDYFIAIHRSLLISADMAHAVHPNYSEKHQPQHRPLMHEGIVIKINANQRYMTDSVGLAILKTLATRADVPIQEFIVRNDSLCGSTIGPMMAAKAGIKTIDIGAPQLSMHSIRETCGVIDLLYYRKLFAEFFTEYTSLSETLLSE